MVVFLLEIFKKTLIIISTNSLRVINFIKKDFLFCF